MEKKHLDLEIATNYLVQLFYQTGRRYSCTRTKLGKMLAIVAFKYARKGIVLFDESIFEYGDNCGAVINGLAMLVDRDAYLSYEYLDIKEDTNNPDEVDFLNQRETGVFIPEKYKKTDGIPDDVKECIKEVFKRFGGYSALLIGHFMNDLVYFPDMIDSNGSIDLEKVCRLTADDVKSIAQNRLIKYLFS